MLTESVTGDCFTTVTDTSAESSDSEESMPGTPILTTAEQIETLYNKLQFMWDDLDRLHGEQEINGHEFDDDGCMSSTQLVAPEPYWDEEEATHPTERQPSRRKYGVSQVLEDTVEGASMTPPPTCVIGNLPPEIIIYIFELALAVDERSSDDAAEFSGPRSWMAPVVLCHVCQSWRDVVLRTSSLWTSFSLVVERPPVSVDGLKASLDLWLRGSKLSKVAVNLEVDPVCASILDGELMVQLEEMLKRSWRFRLNVSHEMFCEILQLQFPRLRTLEVRTSWLAGDIQGLTIQAPKLQELAILGPTMVRFAQDVLPWAQLREYRGMCWADVQRHFEIVRLSPNLESCTLYPFYEMKGLTMPIQLTRLRYLHLVSLQGMHMGGLLRYLEVPILEDLKLEIYKESPAYGRCAWPKGEVLEMLVRSGTQLKNLELVGMGDIDT